MNVLVAVNYNVYVINRFLDRIKNYKKIHKIIIVNYLLSDTQKKQINHLGNAIELDCDIERGYSYALNLGLKYIASNFKTANIIVSNPEVIFEEDIITHLIQKLNNKNVGIVMPHIHSFISIFRGRKNLSLLQELYIKLPFVYKKEIIKEDGWLHYGNDYYDKDSSYVAVGSILFFVTNVKVMEDIDFLDDNTLQFYEEEMLSMRLNKKGYKWLVCNKDTVTWTAFNAYKSQYDEGQVKKIMKDSMNYYYSHYLVKNFTDKIIVKLIFFIIKMKDICIPLYIPIRKTKKLLTIIFRGIKKMWNQHHFLVPPKMWKAYWHKGISKIKNRQINPFNIERYQKWITKKETKILEYRDFDYKPLISIVVPHYNTKKEYLIDCINSILNQSYTNFELCIADDCSTDQESLAVLEKFSKMDPRIKIEYRKENGNISLATNTAIHMAKGEFIAFSDSDDVLDKDALYYAVEALNKNKNLDLIYSDEDKITINGKRLFPHFKPDWSPDTLLSCNYICHFVVARRTLVNQVGGCRQGFEGAQDHDFLLRLTEKTNQIYHIPRILYHWKMVPGSTAVTCENKEYAVEAGKKAIEEALKRRHTKGQVNIINNSTAYYINYDIEDELVSIIIPTRDHLEYLQPCIESIYEKTTYTNFEIIIVDHCTQEKNAIKYLKQLPQKYKNLRVIRREGEFNYSYLNNEATKIAHGKYLVLMNSDIKIITPNWIETMMGYAKQKHIGCVGIKLLYPNNTIQHAGVVLGIDRVAGHAFVGSYLNSDDYFGRLLVPYDYSAVTFACVMISHEKYKEVGGLDEKVKCAFNDVDFCLKILDKGYYNVMLPFVSMYHYESKIRGLDNKGEKLQRFLKEVDFMRDRWKDKIDNDRFYNKNFSKTYPFKLDI